MLNVIAEVLQLFENHSFKAYVVGGFVRDYYMGNISDDIDICTNAHIEDIKQIFNNVVSVDERYGSIVVNYRNIDIEITSFRKDIKYINNRKPLKIEYVNTLEEDLTRRDFIINTLCMDKDLIIIDLFNAKNDIDKKIIRSVGNSDSKISEDSLRILRAIRFATTLGFIIDNELKNAIIDHKDLLLSLSYARRREELDKIFSSINNKHGIALLLEFKLDNILELNNLENAIVTTNILGIWAQLDASDKYFTKKELKIINTIKELIQIDCIDQFVLYKYGINLISILCEIKGINFEEIVCEYNNLPIKSRKDIKFTFNEIKSTINIEENKHIKIIYDDIEKLIVYDKLNNNKEDITNYILSKYNHR